MCPRHRAAKFWQCRLGKSSASAAAADAAAAEYRGAASTWCSAGGKR
jgi:hypothetical protein